MFEGIKRRIDFNLNRGKWQKEANDEIKEEMKRAYMDGYKQSKVDIAKDKGIADGKTKGFGFSGLSKIKSTFLKPYTKEELEILAGKPIWMQNKKEESK
jgi:hypothetical protein